MCTGCRVLKTHDEYHVDRNRKDGCFPYCKECRVLRKKARVAEGKVVPTYNGYADPIKRERHLEAVHKYNEANRETINAKRRESYVRNREKVLAEKRAKYHAERGNVFLDDQPEDTA